MRYALLLTRVAAFTCVCSCWNAWGQTPADVSWLSSDPLNVSKTAWTPQQIAAFIVSTTVPSGPVTVGDFRFLELLADGHLQLVASVDYSGRAFFNEVVVVRKNGVRFAIQRIPTFNLEGLGGLILDLDADLKMELLLPTAFTPYLSGPLPQASWLAVYSWTGTIYEDRTSQYSSYYRSTVLPRLQGSLEAAIREGDEIAIRLAQIEYDKGERLSGSGDTLGLSTAQALAGSSDPNMRIWAAAVFADIGSSEALAALSLLVNDGDAAVAMYAASAAKSGALEHCEHIKVRLQRIDGVPFINLASRRPIHAAVIDAGRGKARVITSSITLGEVGNEQSLIECDRDEEDREDGDHHKPGDEKEGIRREIRCTFSTAASNLQIGDGVATLRARRRDGTCVVGRDSVVVADEQGMATGVGHQ
jgi:hypothetical protein